ncbi:MAG: hypothetical protein LC637_04120 [Xanthomonadaceae bacterium]|nr:hypothetical protein [Xanthomonadaceae bacterium]
MIFTAAIRVVEKQTMARLPAPDRQAQAEIQAGLFTTLPFATLSAPAAVALGSVAKHPSDSTGQSLATQGW